jgi:uncharacterized membrane protein YphA (DoxX/SURF4 family)
MKTVLALNVTVVARVLIPIVFLGNAPGIVDQTIPAKEMAERGVPVGLVPFMVFAGRAGELVGSLALMLGIVPRLASFSPFALLLPATFVSHSFSLAAGTPAFMGQLINSSKNVAVRDGLLFIAGTGNQPGSFGAHHNG